MDAIVNICLGICYGIWDSIKGMTLVFYIDAEIKKQHLDKMEERERRLGLRRRSPTPASASTAGEQPIEALLHKGNSDERSIESIRIRDNSVEKKMKGEAKVAKQVFKCCILNGGFTWLSIIFFEQLLLPALKHVLMLCYGEHNEEELHFIWSWLQSILFIIFGMMWVLPIFLLSKIVSSLWFADIANAAYRVRKGRPQLIPSISKLIADFLFSLIVQALFLMQSMLVNLIPIRYVGSSLCFVHLCLLYSLYCFEYKWFNMGWELHRRLSYIENNWPYFLGFGIPLTVLTNASSSLIVSSCIFSIFFPLFILSGNEAKPIIGTIDWPMRLFSPVIFTSNLFFNRSVHAQRMNKSTANTKSSMTIQQQQLLLQQKALLRQQDLRQQQMELELQSPANDSHKRKNFNATQTPIRVASERGSSGGLNLRPPLIPSPVRISATKPTPGSVQHRC